MLFHTDMTDTGIKGYFKINFPFLSSNIPSNHSAEDVIYSGNNRKHALEYSKAKVFQLQYDSPTLMCN